MSTREQAKKLRLEHPNWSKSDIARATVPPVSPQRIGQIELGTKPATDDMRERIRHSYHRAHPAKYKRKNCRFCE